ncbi:hypothetical protein TVAG_421280 [Trichomonas vaginalis G3]|uniref:Uncharacterized protein n=1 Tax=Trichomonas vaginalis (strain ATCC PRA-98 / G3) TaxID=412133 RepID=A2EVV4_TRIV3|nr:hypothetical protein TVAGG3_0204540 [Trichomonas vaginalis G3]EAY03241.1 hypothetical protein TVAG_421280 [Trichomonas vaginalis G3]KAI5550839.1 hypothetical protein TVAGG3_0204540 [Trichomonas vaginalis G3]|eukprot:XP_001315464.1 hypothetical protein [Trichomonas vaginalis G3]
MVFASLDVVILMVSIIVATASIFVYHVFKKYITHISFYKTQRESLTRDRGKNTYVIEKEPTGGIDVSFIYYIKEYTIQSLNDFINAYDSLEQKFTNIKYEIVLCINENITTVPSKLLNLTKKKTPRITIISITAPGISYFVTGGLRCHGKLLVDYQYFNYLTKFGATKSKQVVTMVDFVNNDPLPGYVPEDFYALGSITYGAFHQIFENVHDLNLATAYEIEKHCKSLKINLQTVNSDMVINIGIQDIWIRKAMIAWVKLLYFLEFFKSSKPTK